MSAVHRDHKRIVCPGAIAEISRSAVVYQEFLNGIMHIGIALKKPKSQRIDMRQSHNCTNPTYIPEYDTVHPRNPNKHGIIQGPYILNRTVALSSSPTLPIPARLHFWLTNCSSTLALSIPLSA